MARERGQWNRLVGIVRPGRGVAGRDLIGPHQERWVRALGSPIHPASLNVYIAGNYGQWPWLLDRFDETTRRTECNINDVRSFVVWLRCPGPSWNEGHDDPDCYRDDTMLQVICSRQIDDIHRHSEVAVEVDLPDLA